MSVFRAGKAFQVPARKILPRVVRKSHKPKQNNKISQCKWNDFSIPSKRANK
jgi:hypothetical protein